MAAEPLERRRLLMTTGPRTSFGAGRRSDTTWSCRGCHLSLRGPGATSRTAGPSGLGEG